MKVATPSLVPWVVISWSFCLLADRTFKSTSPHHKSFRHHFALYITNTVKLAVLFSSVLQYIQEILLHSPEMCRWSLNYSTHFDRKSSSVLPCGGCNITLVIVTFIHATSVAVFISSLLQTVERLILFVPYTEYVTIHIYQHTYATEIKSRTSARTLPHVSAVKSPSSVRSKHEGIHNTNTQISYVEDRSGAVCWRIALQAVRSWVQFPVVSLQFFIDITLPGALWSWGRLSL
jgi:hypothetical protein